MPIKNTPKDDASVRRSATGSQCGGNAATGMSHPLGATVAADGANFSLFSRPATGVELPPLDQGAGNPRQRWIDTALETPNDIVPWEQSPAVPGLTYRVAARSVVALYARSS